MLNHGRAFGVHPRDPPSSTATIDPIMRIPSIALLATLSILALAHPAPAQSVPAGAAQAEAARPLTERGVENLAAFTRLLGYVRYFHPSDQAAATDWNALAVAGVR